MTVLVVLGALVAVLAVACWWEARSGRPAWGSHLRDGHPPTTGHASTAAKRSIGGTVATGAFLGMDGGGDGA